MAGADLARTVTPPEAVSFAGDLEEWLGRDLPATLLWDYPTLAALACL